MSGPLLFNSSRICSQQRYIYRVKSGGWLVHDDQFRIVQQSRDELNLLLHALGELLRLLLHRFGDVHALAPVACALGCGGGLQPVQRAHKDKLVKHLHPLVKPALLRQVADAPQVLAAEWLVEKPHRTGIRH